MYSNNYSIPSNSSTLYGNSSYPSNYTYVQDGDRFFLAPFLVGGLAGTALGYGLANNNQMNNNCCGGGFYPIYPMPAYGYGQQQYGNYGQIPNSFSNYNNNNFYY